MVSLPSRGAWIEIHNNEGNVPVANCRSLHGERGLK